MYFVDEKYDYEELLKLIHTNQSIWGGRYNPIIPLQNGKISEEYQQLIKYYDPDYIFYSKAVNPKVISELRLFNSAGYFRLNNESIEKDISGVSSFYFISNFDSNAKIILPKELCRNNSSLLSFYKTNFGLNKNSALHEDELCKRNRHTIIDVKGIETLNQIIQNEKPINQANLSKYNLNTRILRNLLKASYDCVEIVISKDKTSIQDLLYFWNRHLYECSNIFYATLDEIEELCTDKFFGGVLHDQCISDTLKIISFSLTEGEINSLIELKFKPIALNIKFVPKPIESFPFEVLDANGRLPRDYGESTSIQTLVSEKGLLQIPKLSFTDEIGFFPQRWALDLIIKKGATNHLGLRQFPLTTQTKNIIKGVEGRINLERNISVFIHNQQNTESTLEVNLLQFSHLIRQLITSPVINGEIKDCDFIAVGPHDDSNKLGAFIKTFKGSFDTINKLFTDEFWVHLIEELCTTKSLAGPTITLKNLVSRCEESINIKQLTLDEKERTYRNKEIIKNGVKTTLKELCDYKVFLIGFNIKCSICSSHFWYALTEIENSINCKGCLENFDFPIEPEFTYKLNDLIKNNVYQSPTQRDGNLAVVRSLISIRGKSSKSFEYGPQLNLYDDYHSRKPFSDIDLVAISDGKFIIGEVKHNSKLFSEHSNKALKGLVKMAKEFFPDKIILACYENPNGKLEKAQKGLVHLFNKWEYQPEIEILQLHTPKNFDFSGDRYFYY